MKYFTLKSFSPPSRSAKRELLTKAHKPHQMEAGPGQAAETQPSSHRMLSAAAKLWNTVFSSLNIVHFTWYITHFLHYNLHTGQKHLAKRGQERKGKCLAYGWAPIKCIKNQVWELNSLSNGQPKSSFSLKLSSSSRSPFQIPQAIIYLLPQRAHSLAPQVPTVPALTPSVVIFQQSSEQLVEFVKTNITFCVTTRGFTHQKLVWLLPTCSRLPAARYHFP